MYGRRIAAAVVVPSLVLLLALAAPASANHPVNVEGNCFGPGSGATATGLRRSPVEPGTCGDYDGDGLIGAAEDEDLDNNFGTINAALEAVAQNGTVTIVANGVYPEAVRLTPVEGGSVTLEAAPGVRATIDAVVQGEAGNADRAARTGVLVRGCSECRVTVRNITTRNFARGFAVLGESRALLQRVRAEGNLDYGIKAADRARLVSRSLIVNATGFRKDAAGVAEADPGVGVRIAESAKASIFHGTVSNSRGAGIKAQRESVTLRDVQLFGNHPNLALR